MNRSFGLRRAAQTPQAKAIAKLDKALSELVRSHYEPIGCFTCNWVGPWKTGDCGHFRRREKMSTRFHPKNLGLQCKKCNRFDGGRSYEFGLKLDEVWGKGTAERMNVISHSLKNWDVKELEQLTGAAKLGWLPYLQVYEELTAPLNLQGPLTNPPNISSLRE